MKVWLNTQCYSKLMTGSLEKRVVFLFYDFCVGEAISSPNLNSLIRQKGKNCRRHAFNGSSLFYWNGFWGFTFFYGHYRHVRFKWLLIYKKTSWPTHNIRTKILLPPICVPFSCSSSEGRRKTHLKRRGNKSRDINGLCICPVFVFSVS